jgi:DNA-binding XRE family transcriptional regulator
MARIISIRAIAEKVALDMKVYRVKHGLDQRSMGKLLGLSHATISRIECGRLCELGHLRRICRRLDWELSIKINGHEEVIHKPGVWAHETFSRESKDIGQFKRNGQWGKMVRNKSEEYMKHHKRYIDTTYEMDFQDSIESGLSTPHLYEYALEKDPELVRDFMEDMGCATLAQLIQRTEEMD